MVHIMQAPRLAQPMLSPCNPTRCAASPRSLSSTPPSPPRQVNVNLLRSEEEYKPPAQPKVGCLCDCC